MDFKRIAEGEWAAVCRQNHQGVRSLLGARGGKPLPGVICVLRASDARALNPFRLPFHRGETFRHFGSRAFMDLAAYRSKNSVEKLERPIAISKTGRIEILTWIVRRIQDISPGASRY